MKPLDVIKLFAGALCLTGLSAPGTAVGETLLERGNYLMWSITACGNCHTPKGPGAATKELAGGFEIKSPVFVARVPNITPHKKTGIGNWTDAQIVNAIRNGRRPDNSIIGPPMAIEMFNGLSDRDVKSIVAYLRSVTPIDNKVAKSTYKIPLHAPPPVTTVAEVPRSDKVRYGEYLAGPLGHCIECHTPAVRRRRDYKNQLGAGGFPLGKPGGGVLFSANLTPDPETGIGKWSDADIKKAIKQGVRPDGKRLSPPMAFSYYYYYYYYYNISADDLDAIVAYLRSLKPIKHAVKRNWDKR